MLSTIFFARYNIYRAIGGPAQKNETVLYLDPKRPVTAGTPLANLAPVKAEARNETAWQIYPT